MIQDIQDTVAESFPIGKTVRIFPDDNGIAILCQARIHVTFTGSHPASVSVNAAGVFICAGILSVPVFRQFISAEEI